MAVSLLPGSDLRTRGDWKASSAILIKIYVGALST